MRKLAVTAALAFAFTATPVASAGEWPCQTPSGNEVQGQCNGVPLDVVNPGGNVPPGQN